MSELEEIRQRKVQELQEQAEFQQQVNQLEAIVKSLFTKEALQRYGNLKAAHPEQAVKLLTLVAQQMQKGNARKISDEDLKRMLVMLQPKTRQIKITRK